MSKIGFDFPAEPRQTALYKAELWYQQILAERLGQEPAPILRSNFGQYEMAVNYQTSVLEESKAINRLAIYNIDHMAQVRFTGADAATLLHRVLPADITGMKINQCKYTLLLTEQGTVVDDMIVMRLDEHDFILVINAGHDLTATVNHDGQELNLIADADHIIKHLKDGEQVTVADISHELVKIDVQGPYCYKLIEQLYGEDALKNPNNPKKNLGFFTFNQFQHQGHSYLISRTGYTNRWGFELYVPVAVAEDQFKRIINATLEMGGLLVGLGGRDENRLSAGNVGLPLNGQEYDHEHTPVNAPLFAAAVDMTKDFVGKAAVQARLEQNPTNTQVLVISEGIVSGRGVYLNGQRLGSVTSSINSPNVALDKRQFLGSKRKNVNEENGVAAIGLAWLNNSPYAKDEAGNDITEQDGKPVWIKVELYREKDGTPNGKPVLGFIAADGVNPATAPKPLKNIAKL